MVHCFVIYAQCVKITANLTFDYSFGKCRPISKILSLSDSQENLLCNYCRIFHVTLSVAKFKNIK